MTRFDDEGGSGPIDGGRAEDMLVSGRRGELTEGERHQLERALDVDPTLRIAHQVGRDFDRIATVRAGDDELIARVAGRVLTAQAPAGRRRAPRRVALAIGLGLALAASGAAAWWATTSAARRQAKLAVDARVPSRTHAPAGNDHDRRGARAEGSSPLDTRPLAPTGPGDGAAFVPTEASPPGEGPADSRAAAAAARIAAPPTLAARTRKEPSRTGLRAPRDDARAAESARAPAPQLASPVTGPSAATLFHDANSARHAGDLGRARALYREVEARFPTSNEARLSIVSLGKLLLGAGDARAAEDEFSRYLSTGGGALMEEALVGQAQCDERLGRADDERRVWQRLLRDFPASVYAARARQREAQLGARGATAAP